MSVSIVEINGKQFVSGLLWQVLERPRDYMREAREIGKTLNMDIVAIRKTSMIRQAGFVKRSEGAYKGMYSLAAMLAGVLGGTFIAAFKLPNGEYAFCAAHAGSIVPETDRVDSKEEIEHHVRALWQRTDENFHFAEEEIFVPSEWEFGGRPLDIEALLKEHEIKKEYRLQALTMGLSKDEIVKLSAVLAVCMIFGVAYYSWAQWHAEKIRIQKEKEAAMERLRLEELNRLAKQKQDNSALNHPWSEIPDPASFLSVCNSGVSALPLSIGGWVFDSADCMPKSIHASYRRTRHTTVKNFQAAAEPRFDTAPVYAGGGNAARVTEQMTVAYRGNDVLSRVEESIPKFSAHFQKLDIKVSMKQHKEEPKKALPGGQAPALSNRQWKEFDYSFTTGVEPDKIFRGITSLAGLRITTISVVLKDSALIWSVEGKLYAKQ